MKKVKDESDGDGGFAVPLFLAGVATGVGLTMLLAPRSGAATRRLIGRSVQEGDDWVQAKAAAAKGYAKRRGDELQQRVREVAAALGRESCQSDK